MILAFCFGAKAVRRLTKKKKKKDKRILNINSTPVNLRASHACLIYWVSASSYSKSTNNFQGLQLICMVHACVRACMHV